MVAEPYQLTINRVLRGKDGKIRATYRVLLAFVAFFVSLFAGLSAADMTGLILTLPVAALSYSLSALVMALLFYFIWVTRLDKRSFAEYGFDLSGRDAGLFAVAFLVTLTGFGFWYLFGILTGQMSVDVVLSFRGGSVALGALWMLVAVTAGAVVQDLAFLGLIFTNSIAGIQSRVENTNVALMGGFAVTGVLFVAYHLALGAGPAGYLLPLQAAVFLLVGLAYFSIVYVYTGSLTAAIGAHAATNYSGFLYGWNAPDNITQFAIPEMLTVSGSTPVTEVIGPIPLTAFIISILLLIAVFRLPLLTPVSERVPVGQ